LANSPRDAEDEHRKALVLDPLQLDSLYVLAWSHLRTPGGAGRARALLEHAVRLADDIPAVHDALGTACAATGDFRAAAAAHRRALALTPGNAEINYNLANALSAAGQADEAEAAFAAALRHRPAFPEAYNNLGSLLARLGRLDEAVRCFRLALALDSDYLDARNNLGNALKDKGDLAGAEACLNGILATWPEAEDARFILASVQSARGKTEQAIESYRRVLVIRPDRLEALNNLGALLRDEDRLADGLSWFARLCAARPDMAEAHTNLGNVLRAEGRLADALTAQRRAIALRPDYARGYGNLGSVHFEQGRSGAALAAFRRSLQISPDAAEVRTNLAIALLLRGEFDEGWREYECRWDSGHRHIRPRKFARPPWRGEPVAGKTILVHAEQGFGDAIQFVRYAPALADAGARVVLMVYRPLVRLMATVGGIAEIIAEGDNLPPFDWHIPMMSLPYRLNRAIPADIPYLRAEDAAKAEWAARLAALPGCKVGLVWAGEPRLHDPLARAIDSRRSMALTTLSPLLEVEGVSFVSLQKGSAAAQLGLLPPARRLPDFGAELKDFADTAALVANLDLVIAVDTSIVHLAGALGKPVWILSRFDGCWRWLEDREDSPWYPSARVFRQPAAGDWASVVARVTTELRDGMD
jgi:tetratricopeptide (TPR) repeat protein